MREPLEQVRASLRRETLGVAQRPGVLSFGLTMGPDSCGLIGRRGREPQHRDRVRGPVGVVREPRQVSRGLRRLRQRRQNTPVEREAHVRCESGTASRPDASTSVAKNGFPPVRSYNLSALTADPCTSLAIAWRDRPVSPR